VEQYVFVDYYEVLQISPNADQETIHRVYRIQAQRFHPDNQETGDPLAFRRIYEAYQILSDTERRALYDIEHRNAGRQKARTLFEQANASEGVDAERQKRHDILSLLYKKRLSHPEQPSMTLRDLEEILAIPRQQLEFSLWFLKEGGFLIRTDSAKHTITMKGAELVESLPERPASKVQRLTGGSRVA
jgi:curved DNA-binding protein CbpA